MYFKLQLLPQKERGFSLHYSWSRSVMFTNSIKMGKWFSPKLNFFFINYLWFFSFLLQQIYRNQAAAGAAAAAAAANPNQQSLALQQQQQQQLQLIAQQQQLAGMYIYPHPRAAIILECKITVQDFVPTETKNVKSQNKSWKKSLRRGIMPQRRWLGYFFLFWLKNWKIFMQKKEKYSLCFFFLLTELWMFPNSFDHPKVSKS